MPDGNISRRTILRATGIAAVSAFASPIRAAAPEPTTVTPALIAAIPEVLRSVRLEMFRSGIAILSLG